MSSIYTCEIIVNFVRCMRTVHKLSIRMIPYKVKTASAKAAYFA